jgi:hypothetical protein
MRQIRIIIGFIKSQYWIISSKMRSREIEQELLKYSNQEWNGAKEKY